MYTAQVGNLQNPTEEAGFGCNLAIIELHIFADKYQSWQLMNFAMGLLQDSLNEDSGILSFREVEIIFKFTESGSNHPLRSFAIALMACAVLHGPLGPSLEKMERIFKEILSLIHFLKLHTAHNDTTEFQYHVKKGFAFANPSVFRYIKIFDVITLDLRFTQVAYSMMAYLTATLLGNELVQIIVGPELKEFFVHKTLLRSTCDFFDKAFQGKFKEGVQNKMYLPEDNPEIFEIFVNWMYSGHLKGGLREPMLIIDIWIFAQKCQAITLKNCAMNALQDALGDERIGRFPLSNFEVTHIYEHTTWGDELRVFAIAMLAWEIQFGDSEDVANLESIFNDISGSLEEVLDFTRDFGGMLIPNPRVQGGRYDKCAFHEHNDNNELVCVAALNSHQFRNIH